MLDPNRVAVPDDVGGKVLSVVLPMRNEGASVDRLFARLVPALDATGLAWDVVVVDDGSTDDTLDRLKAWRAALPMLRVVSLSRNFGKEIAVAAGLSRASGDAVVVMDADLQHPPEAIAAMVAAWRGGAYGIVQAKRVGYDRGSLPRRASTAAFYWIFDRLCDVPLDREACDFALLDRKVVDAFLAMPERHRFNRGLIAWAGFRRTSIPVVIENRAAGSSRFGFLRLLRLALAAITAFGTFPLRVWTYIGTVVSLAGLGFGVFIVGRTILVGSDVPGYPSLVAAIVVLSGVQLIGLGIIGEYLGHVFAEVKRRPLYFVQEEVGFDDRRALRPARAVPAAVAPAASDVAG